MTDSFPVMIPRAILFGNPDRFGGSISPDGQMLGWIAPDQGVNNIWIAPRDRPDAARCLTQDRDQGIHGFNWAFDGRHIFFEQDFNGDEQHRLHALDRETGAVRDLLPGMSGQVGLALASIHVPDAVIISSNARDPSFPDLFRVDLKSGEYVLHHRNDGFDEYLLDDDYVVRLATRMADDGSLTIFKRTQDGWSELVAIGPDDARVSGPIGLDRRGRTLFMLDSRGRDTAALVAVAIDDGSCNVLYEAENADITGVITDNRTYVPHACIVTRERMSYIALDDRFQADIAQLNAAELGDWSIASRSADDRWWIVSAASDTRPGVAWLLDRETRALSELFHTRPLLADLPLAPMQSLTIAARDGLDMVSYLTLPVGTSRDASGRPAKPIPMVLLVHGGPWARDHFGFNTLHQWLANRGYAVFSVNFRGSSGFGKAFLAAGDGQWGARMDDDLLDAVDWAVDQGIADPERVAIMGGSYGGYATLSAMTRSPTRFACGVDIVGPSNLETLLAATPPWWHSMRATLYRAIGNPETEEGRSQLRDRSPLHRAGAIQRPLLIGQGANDPRVRQAEADQMAEAMRRHDVPLTYILFPDEGHGFARPQNAVAFNAVTEAFLAQWLGGRFEPIAADELQGSSMRIIDGDAWLDAALPGEHMRTA